MQADDIQQIHRWLSNESLFRTLRAEPPNLALPMQVLVVMLEDGTRVGWVEVFNVDQGNRKCEVGIAIPSRRGRGLSRRVGKHALRWLFGEAGMNRVYARIPESNRLSIRLVESLGFTHEGIEREALLRDGRFEDIHVYAMTRTDFKGGR